MTQQKPDAPMSDLAKALEARKPQYFDSAVADLVGEVVLCPDGEPIQFVKVRVASKGEQDRALIEAHRYVKRMAADVPAAANDPDILLDAKNACIIATVFRDADAPDAMPAFRTGQWVIDKLTTYQIGRMLNAYADVLRRAGEVKSAPSDDEVESLATLCAYLEPERASTVLVGASREYLADVTVALSKRLEDTRIVLQDAMARLEGSPDPANDAPAPVADAG